MSYSVSAMFTGFALGSFLSVYAVRCISRIGVMHVSIAFSIVTMYASSFTENIVQFGTVQFFYGLSQGFFTPLVSTFLSESVPTKYRAAAVTVGQGLIFIIAEALTIFVGQLTLGNENLKTGDWRLF